MTATTSAPHSLPVHAAQTTTPSQTIQHSQFLPPKLFQLLTTPTPTVSSVLASSPEGTKISDVATKLYGSHHGHAHHSIPQDEAKEHAVEGEEIGGGEKKVGTVERLMEKLHMKTEDQHSSGTEGNKDKYTKNAASDQWASMRALRPEELEEVRKCGRWGGAQPSELFLNMFAQTLITLEENPLNGMVSPPLIGSCGVVPLTIISVIPDIIQHHADVIVRAEREIFLATNFWEASGAAQTIVDAFKELSRRVVEAKRPKVIIKLMYDRGNPHQVIEPHQAVDEKTYTGDKVKLPHPKDLPGCDLQVQNYHLPPVGTFHAKYMVVDRKIAILNSNNIQDRVNVEMMTHIEGPVVQSFYDMALLSWWTTLTPPLPLLASPPTYPEHPSKSDYAFGHAHPLVGDKGDLDSAASKSRKTLAEHHAQAEQPNDGQVMEKKKEVWDSGNEDEAERVDNQFDDESKINQHLNTGSKIDATDIDPPPNAAAFKPILLLTEHDPVPMALVNRCPRGLPGHADTFVPQDQAWLAGFKFAKEKVFIQTPTFNAKPVVEAALDACRRGILVEIYADLGFNDEGELLPYQGGTNEMVANYMYGNLTGAAKDKLKIYWYTGKDQKTPLNASHKSRNCHVKLMIVDGHIGMQGNGNQDSQSWYHSQEINVLLDSPIICDEWMQAIDANQNTRHYGLVDPADGIWRDKEGKTLPDWKKPPKGPLKSLVGVKGAIQRVRGEGGF